MSEAVAHFKLSKAKLYELMNLGLIKHSSLRRRGQVKGTRLISYDSLQSYLESNSTGGVASEQ